MARSLDAENLDYEEVTSALHEALEADLSSLGWIGNSQSLLKSTFEALDILIDLAEHAPKE